MRWIVPEGERPTFEPPKIDPELREVLDNIDQVLAKNDSNAKALWDVLTALRGPDSLSYDLKSGTTAKIRKLAFPQASDRFSRAVFEYGTVKEVTYDDLAYAVAGRHFFTHIDAAAQALGLVKWVKNPKQRVDD
jgi:hypothetical protein